MDSQEHQGARLVSMTLTKPRLVLLKGMIPPDDQVLDHLQSVFVLVEADDIPSALKLVDDDQTDTFLFFPHQVLNRTIDESAASQPDAQSILGQIGDGVAIVDEQAQVIWSNERFLARGPAIQQQFIEHCQDSIREFGHQPPAKVASDHNPCLHYTFTVDQAHFEMLVCPNQHAFNGTTTEHSVVGLLWEITTRRELQSRIDAIDAAGSELMRIEAASIAQLSMPDRLKLLEEKIVHYVHDLLQFDNFEIRFLDRDTNQLELVISEGLSPLKIGEVIHAEPEENGISGYVAALGVSYLCPDVSRDPLYREGLVNAGSSLTVPLRLHDRVIGVFNIESDEVNSFNDNDRQFAEIFGRYIAMAMNILDLLVVERYTTNEEVASVVLDEVTMPLADIVKKAQSLQAESVPEEPLKHGLDQIITAAKDVRQRMESCAAGPRTILGAEKELHRLEPDPRMVGKRVLVADDEPAICDTISTMLAQKGCRVTVCRNGLETIEIIETNSKTSTPYDLVISDIKMPDRNGYEVFRAVKEVDENTPVILMTGFGYDPHHSIVRASQEGLSSFLFKPFQASQLLDAVDKALLV